MNQQEFDAMVSICKSLHLERVSRLVLEFEVGQPVRCYAVLYPLPEDTAKVADSFIQLVSAVHVANDSTIETVRLPEKN